MSTKANEQEIEKEIIEKGLTAPRITPELISSKIKSEDYYVFPGSTVTVCLLTLENGFSVIGHSATASPDNFDEEIGRKIAKTEARDKIWRLEGYFLSQKLYEKNK